jgi:hypothetical protein
MAKQTINIGAAANDGTGDPIRTAFGKVNDNFTEIYTANTGVNTGDQNLAAYATTAAVAAGYQPLDSDLTAIAALTTTAYGRALLSTADAPTLRTAIGLGQTDAPTFLAQSLTGQSLTGTQATSLVDLATTWLSTTGTPTAIKLNVADTANVPAASNLMDLQVGGVSKFKVNKAGRTMIGNVLDFGTSTLLSWENPFLRTYSPFSCTSLDIGASGNLILANDAAGILAQRNGTAAQAFRVYNTDPVGGAKEWGGLAWSGNEFRVESAATGGGSIKRTILGGSDIVFVASSGARWQITSTALLAFADNAYDIGASGANRPRNIYVAGSLYGDVIKGNTLFSDGLIRNWSNPLRFIGSRFQFDVDGQSGTGIIQIGGTTDAFPAIARDGAGIKFTGAAAGSTSWIKVPAVTVSALPAAATAGVGARAFVNDALTPVFGSAVTGGGAVAVPVYSTGSAWNVG